MFASSRWEKLVFQLSTSGVFHDPENNMPASSNKSSLLSGNQFAQEEDEIKVEKTVWQPPNSLKVTAEITSDNENMDSQEVKAHFSYDLKLFANVEVIFSEIVYRIIEIPYKQSVFSSNIGVLLILH